MYVSYRIRYCNRYKILYKNTVCAYSKLIHDAYVKRDLQCVKRDLQRVIYSISFTYATT
jgi:hypothetical protein